MARAASRYSQLVLTRWFHQLSIFCLWSGFNWISSGLPVTRPLQITWQSPQNFTCEWNLGHNILVDFVFDPSKYRARISLDYNEPETRDQL
jgi:hypothetical protein